MLSPIVIAIPHRRLHRLRRLTRPTHNLLRHLGGRRRLLAHGIRIRHFRLSRLVLALHHIDLVFAVFLDEGGEILDGAGAAVDDGLGFGAGGEELDGWEAGDFVGNIVGGGVDFGNGNLGGVAGGVHGGEFFVFGGKTGGLVRNRVFDVGKGRGKHTLCNDRTTGRRTLQEHLSRCQRRLPGNCGPPRPEHRPLASQEWARI